MKDRTRGLLIAVAFIVSAVVFVPLATIWVYLLALSDEVGNGPVVAVLVGGLVGLTLGLGPLVAALLTGARSGLWVALALVLLGLGGSTWFLATA
jgi:hypothetical protein